jgi:hypothetical protein
VAPSRKLVYRSISVRTRWALAFSALFAAEDRGAFGQAAPPPTHDVASVFFIAKSQNKNQVHYGIRVDTGCAPVGREPVYAYWRLIEDGGRSEPLLDIEQSAYGVASQEDLPGSAVRLVLRAFPRRSITITTERDGQRCRAAAVADINGRASRVDNIYVKLRWPFGIDYLLMSGHRIDDGTWVRERIQP